MANAARRDWNKERGEKREKLTYALMAASGGCIGYAMTQAKDLSPDWAHWVLVIALLFWCASFWCGFNKVAAEIDCLQHHGNIEENLNQSLEHRAANARAHERVLLNLDKALGVASNSYLWHQKYQVRMLIAGVISYGAWQALMMFARAINP